MTKVQDDVRKLLYGYTSRCRVCLKPEKKCVCPICPKCFSVADDNCYTHHGLTSHEVAVARQEWLVESKQMALNIELEALEEIKDDEGYVYPFDKHTRGEPDVERFVEDSEVDSPADGE